MDNIKEFFKLNWHKILGVIGAIIIAYAGGNIKTFGDLVSFIGAQETSNKAALETLQNNLGDVAVVDSEGEEIPVESKKDAAQ